MRLERSMRVESKMDAGRGGGSVGVGKGVVFVFSIGYVMLIEDIWNGWLLL